MRRVKDLDGKPNTEWLGSLGLFIEKKRRLRGDLFTA